MSKVSDLSRKGIWALGVSKFIFNTIYNNIINDNLKIILIIKNTVCSYNIMFRKK